MPDQKPATLVPVRIDVDNTLDSYIFLGIWALKEKTVFNDLDSYDVISYHYDNYKKLEDDFNYTYDLYQNILPIISRSLNNIHHEDLSTQGWDLYLGKWLRNFVEIFLDRYTSIRTALSNDRVESSYFSKDVFTPPLNGMDYLEKVKGDEYNLFLYSYIIENIAPSWKKIHVSFNCAHAKKEIKGVKFRKITQYFFDKLIPNPKVVFDCSGFSVKSCLSLIASGKLKIKPLLFTPNNVDQMVDLNSNDREKITKDILSDINVAEDDFVYLLSEAIGKHIPMSYIENYDKSREQARKYTLPKGVIYSANKFNTSDEFRLGISKSRDLGANFIIGQHGGHYGLFKWSSVERYELDCSDKFISFGWELKLKNISPISHPKLIDNNKPKSKSLVVFVTNSFPRYFYRNWSNPVPGFGIVNYLKDRDFFIKSINHGLQQDIIIRLHHNDNGWGQKEHISNSFPHIKLDDHKQSFMQVLNKSKLVIVDNNHTTYLESISNERPTVIWWDPDFWPLSSDVIDIFDDLRDVKIFHDSVESAVDFVNKLYSGDVDANIDNWWNSEKVQSSILTFQNLYTKKNSNWKREYIDLFNTLNI